MIVTMVPSEYAETELFLMYPMVMKTLEYSGGRYNFEWLAEELKTMKQSLWIVVDDNSTRLGFLTVRILEYPTGLKTLCYEMAGGSLEDNGESIALMQETMEEYGRYTGCSKIEVRGRVGWRNRMKEHGYTQTGILGEKEL